MNNSNLAKACIGGNQISGRRGPQEAKGTQVDTRGRRSHFATS